MSTSPRFKKYIKAITVTSGGTGYQAGNKNVLTSGDQQYAIDYFGDNYVLYYGQSTTTLTADLKVLISAPTSTIPGDTPVQATGTITLSSSGVITAITMTNIGDGYITEPTVDILGTPNLVTDISTTDTLRDDGTYTNIPTTSVDGIGTGVKVDIIIESGKIVKILPTGGEDYKIGEELTIDAIAIGGTGDEDPINFTVTKINGGSGATFTVELDQVGKPDDYYVEKLSPVIENQIPEFVRDEYPLFASFIKKYYEYMDDNDATYGMNPNNVLNTIQDRLDVDFNDANEETSTDFLEQFFEDYGKDFPISMAGDKRLLVKNIRDFYTSKGTAKAVENLFKIMYNENIEVFVPNTHVLRPSDNTWTREYVVKVYENIFLPFLDPGATIFDPAEFEGKEIVISHFESIGSVTNRKERKANVSQVKKISFTVPQAYELTLDLPVDYVIPGVGSGATFTAVIGGKIASTGTVSAADSNRTSGTYTIGASDYTTSGNGTGATFSIVVDGSGSAEITTTGVGLDYAPDETITVPNVRLGNGSGAAALTFKVATITEGKIHSVTIDSAGNQYSSNIPLKVTPNTADTITTEATPLMRVTNGSVTSIIFTDGVQGVGYNHVPTLRESNYFQQSYISLSTDDRTLNVNKKAIPGRILSGAVVKSTSGEAIGGFAVGQSYKIDENASLSPYAIDYFAGDYTLTGIANNSFVKVSQISSTGFPTALDVIAIGAGFTGAHFDVNIVSPLGYTATLTCTTGYNAVYPGMFAGTSGFLSDANKAQDNRLYQAFSYQVRSERPKSEWGEYVKRAAHPAGMVAFSDLQITNTIDFSGTTTVDTDLFFYVVMPDIDVISVQDVLTKDMHLPLVTDVPTTSEPYYSMEPGLHKVDTTDFIETLAKDVETIRTDVFNPFHGSLIFDVEAVLPTENSVMSDSISTFEIGRGLTDTFAGADVIQFGTETAFTEQIKWEDVDSEYATDYFLNDGGAYTEGVPLVVLHFDKHFDQLSFGAYATDYFAEVYTDETSETNSNNAGDRPIWSDAPSLHVVPETIIDTFSVQDTPIMVLIINRTVADSLNTADTLNLMNIELSKTEVPVTSDSVNVIEFTTAFTELANTQEATVVKDIFNGYSESIATLEGTASYNVLIFPSINKADTSNTAESGSVTQSDYGTSTDYFLEDYVATEVRSIA
tara:strand:- start:60568 stop:64092 length:3525 start_codon:yes stop_codon:yes gene_type:complete